jgi:hypothetical protein
VEVDDPSKSKNEEWRLTKRSRSEDFRSQLTPSSARCARAPSTRGLGAPPASAERTIRPIDALGATGRRARDFL